MTEYITKEQAIEAMDWVWVSESERLRIEYSIEDIPAADVTPVVHAEWIGTWGDGYAEDEEGNPQIVYEEFECSRCGCVHHADGEPEWDYCPNCGARMGGGESNA